MTILLYPPPVKHLWFQQELILGEGYNSYIRSVTWCEVVKRSVITVGHCMEQAKLG